MPITQQFNINTGDAYEGMVYGMRTAMTIRTVEAHDVPLGQVSAIEAGKPVVAKADTVRGVNNSGNSTANANCYGIIVRQINHEAATRPSLDGQMAIMSGDLLGMMVEGEVMVKLSATVARDAKLGFVAASKTWSTANAYQNVVALKAGKAGDIIPVRIFSAA